MNQIDYYDDDFSVTGKGFKNPGGSKSFTKTARGGGKRTKKAAQDNKDKVYNSKTARHKVNLMTQVGSKTQCIKGNKGKENSKKSKGKGKKF